MKQKFLLVICLAAIIALACSSLVMAMEPKIPINGRALIWEKETDLDLRKEIYKKVRRECKEGFENLRNHINETVKKANRPTGWTEKKEFYLGRGLGFRIETPEYSIIILTREFEFGPTMMTVQAENKTSKEVLRMTDVNIDGDVDKTAKPVLEKEKKFDHFLRIADSEIKKKNYIIFLGGDDVDYYLFEQKK